MFNRKRQKGFTLIELLIVVAIIGIIAAILIPNLLDALQKAKQKRTMSDVRNTGTAWMSWLTDQIGAASAGSAKTYEASDLENPDYSVVFGYLHPSSTFFYMQEVPEIDGWRYELEFGLNPNLLASNVILIGAPCRDGVFTAGPTGVSLQITPFIATDYDLDIIWADGYFVSWPEGTKR